MQVIQQFCQLPPESSDETTNESIQRLQTEFLPQLQTKPNKIISALFRRDVPERRSVAWQFCHRLVTASLQAETPSIVLSVIEVLCEFQDFQEIFKSEKRLLNFLLETWPVPVCLGRLIKWEEILEETLILLICNQINDENALSWIEATRNGQVVDYIQRHPELIHSVIQRVSQEKSPVILLTCYTWLIRVCHSCQVFPFAITKICSCLAMKILML
jgi:hypothetical protein